MLTEVVKVRVTPAEKVAIQKAASKEERSMSDWARLRLRDAAGLNGDWTQPPTTTAPRTTTTAR
jgi:Mobilization protein NikA